MNKKFILNLLITLTPICIFCFCFLSINITLLTLGLIALSLGLRHGLDADHIVAIDNITRKLLSEQKNSLSTGLFFALGHSTIVFLLTLAITLSLPFFHHAFTTFQNFGGVAGTGISVTFLWITALMNVTTLSSLLKNKQSNQITPRGILAFFGKHLLSKIDRPSKMYFVGFLFGLGFDTATEVGLLSMAATATLHHLQLWLILLLPILFASGMVLTDSLDCVFMNTVYNWPPKYSAKLRHYKIAIIGFTTFAAFTVGLFELIALFGTTWHWQNIIISAGQFLNNHSEEVGICIISLFIFLWLMMKREW